MMSNLTAHTIRYSAFFPPLQRYCRCSGRPFHGRPQPLPIPLQKEAIPWPTNRPPSTMLIEEMPQCPIWHRGTQVIMPHAHSLGFLLNFQTM